MQVYGFLEKAQLENVASDLSNTLAGLVWFNTTDSSARFYDGSAVRTVADLNSTQTLINKILTGNQMANLSPDGVETLTFPVATDTLVGRATTDTLTNKTVDNGSFNILNLSEETTPANPISGLKLYAKSDGIIYKLDSDGNEIAVGSGLGSLDYFYSEDFSATSASDLQVTGTITVADEIAAPISGARSIKVTQVSGSLGAIIKIPSNIVLPINAKGTTIGLQGRYKYSGDSNDIDFVGYDETNGEVIHRVALSKVSNPRTFQIISDTVSSGNEISWYFEVMVENIGAVLDFDNIEGLVNPVQIAEFTTVNSVRLEGNGAENITANTENIVFNGSGAGWDSGAYDYTVQNNDSIIMLSGMVFEGAPASDSVSIYVNGVKYKSVHFARSTYLTAGAEFVYISTLGEFQVGQKISFRSDVTINLVNNVENHYLNIVESKITQNVVASSAKNAENSMIRIHTGNGHGSTNTRIRRFSNVVENLGNAIGYVDSATDGASFEIKENGLYYISYSELNGSTLQFGISKNSTQLTTDVSSITSADRLCISTIGSTGAPSHTSWAGTLSKGDILRAHTRGSGTNSNDQVQLTISKIGVSDLVGVPLPIVGYLKETQPSATNAGSSAANTVQTRALNTIEGDFGRFGSLSSNQFTLEPGDYDIEASSTAFQVDRHQIFIHDGSNYIIDGIGVLATAASSIQNTSTLSGRISISVPTTFELRHWTEQTKASNGLGIAVDSDPSNPQSTEVYSQVKITKLR